MRFMRVLSGLALLLVASAAFAADALIDAREGEVLLGPLPLRQTVDGIPLDLRGSIFVRLHEENASWVLGVRLVTDLADLQRKIGTFIDTVPLPKNECDHLGVDNQVVTVWGKELLVSGSTATMQLNGDFDLWTCQKAVPCSRVDWDGLLPRVTFYDCNPPVKFRNVRQPFTARLPFALITADDQTLAVRVDKPQIDLGGPGGNLTEAILKIVGLNLDVMAEQMLKRAVDPESLRLSLHRELQQFTLRIADARLLENNGSLAAAIELRASVPADKAGELLPILTGAH